MNTMSVKKTFSYFLSSNDKILLLILIGFTLIFSVFLNPMLVISNYSYQLGDVAKRDIKAPKDFFVEDSEATKTNVDQAVKSVLTIYDHDKSLSSTLIIKIKLAFQEVRAVYEAPVGEKPDLAKKPDANSGQPVKKTIIIP